MIVKGLHLFLSQDPCISNKEEDEGMMTRGDQEMGMVYFFQTRRDLRMMSTENAMMASDYLVMESSYLLTHERDTL